jgi:hypothetical protein
MTLRQSESLVLSVDYKPPAGVIHCPHEPVAGARRSRPAARRRGDAHSAAAGRTGDRGHNEQLRAIVKELQRALFGRPSEKAAHPDQLQLALEDIEQALAKGVAEAEKTDATRQASRRQQRRVNRGTLTYFLITLASPDAGAGA